MCFSPVFAFDSWFSLVFGVGILRLVGLWVWGFILFVGFVCLLGVGVFFCVCVWFGFFLVGWGFFAQNNRKQEVFVV